MRQNKIYLPKDIPFPFYGLNTVVPASQLKPNFSPNCKNIEFRDNVISVRRGSVALGDSVQGIPLQEISFTSDTGILQTILITTLYQYIYDSSGVWTELYNKVLDAFSVITNWTGGSGTTPSLITGKVGNALRLTTVSVAIAQLAYCSDYNPVKDLTKGNSLSFWFRSSIALDANDLSIVLAENSAGAKTGDFIECKLPAIAAATWTKVHITGNFSALNVVKSVGIYQLVDKANATFDFDSLQTHCAWTGDESNLLDYVDGTDDNGRYLFLTNGKDRPIYWDGSKISLFYPSSGLTNFNTCRVVAMFYGSLVLCDLTINSLRYQNYVAYSTVGATIDFFDFSSVGSDLVLIADAAGPIIRALPLYDRLIIYTKASVVMITYVGGDEQYSTQLVIKGSAEIISGRAIANLGFAHVYMSQDGIRLFDGTAIPREVATRIANVYRNIIDYGTYYNAFVFYDDIRQCLYFSVPTASGTTRIFLLDLKDFTFNDESMAWTELEYPERLTFMSHFKECEALTYDSPLAQVPYESCFFSYDDSVLKESFPIVVLGTASGLFTLNKFFANDNGTPFDAVYDFTDFTSPEFLSMTGRFVELEFDGFGQSVDLYYSINEGRSWTLIDTQALTVNPEVYKLFFDVTGKKVRIRLRSEDFFCVRWLRVWFVVGGL